MPLKWKSKTLFAYLQPVFDEQNNDKGDFAYVVLESQEFFLQEGI